MIMNEYDTQLSMTLLFLGYFHLLKKHITSEVYLVSSVC